MSTEVATIPAASVTLPTGAVITSDMTPQERFNIVAKAHGAPTVETPKAPPQVHTPETVGRLAAGERQHAAETAHEAGELARLMAPKVAPVAKAPKVGTPEYVTAYRAALDDAFRQTPAEQRTPAWYEQWNQEKADALNGRKAGEARDKYLARIAGKEEAEEPPTKIVPAKLEVVPPQGTPEERAAEEATPFTPQQWQEGHASVTDADGIIPIERVNSAGLSGYTLPKLIENQVVDSTVFAALADARKAGISQEQVNKWFESQMRRDGWIK